MVKDYFIGYDNDDYGYYIYIEKDGKKITEDDQIAHILGVDYDEYLNILGDFNVDYPDIGRGPHFTKYNILQLINHLNINIK
jgi:hypothetical protein